MLWVPARGEWKLEAMPGKATPLIGASFPSLLGPLQKDGGGAGLQSLRGLSGRAPLEAIQTRNQFSSEAVCQVRGEACVEERPLGREEGRGAGALLGKAYPPQLPPSLSEPPVASGAFPPLPLLSTQLLGA